MFINAKHGRVTGLEGDPRNCLPILGEDKARQDPSGGER